MPNYDIVIAGGGPTGSMAALALSRAGKRVLVVEKVLFPRAKVCGNSLNPSIWSLWQRHGLAERFMQLPHYNIAGFTLEWRGVPVLRHGFGSRHTRTMDREVLDDWLATEAQAAGATYLFNVGVQGLTPTQVRTSCGDIEAPLVLGADGRNSAIGRAANLAVPPEPCGRVGWRAFVDSDSFDDHVHINVFPEGYYGVNRINSSRMNITMALFADAAVSPAEIAARYIPEAAGAAWKSMSPISRPAWEVTDGRCWLAGDAARVLEPLTGEGIYSALATGEMAARHILSIDRVGLAAAMAGYRREHRRFYGRRIWLNSCVRWALEDSRRSMRIMRGLSLWPMAAEWMVNRVHSPENPHLLTG